MISDDAISRKEAIRVASGYCHTANIHDELAKLPSVNPKPCEDAISRADVLDLCESKDSNYAVIHFKEDVECLPSVTPQQKVDRWIPVGEKSPLEGQLVLCSIAEYADTVHRIIIAKYETNSLYWDEFVTAWMPLPKPYKGESSEE